ncbi:hypothetical protein KOW79_006602 [Hemibagrus wyckioides]|uniref:Uncharacterized protein n=1 Tax=Hemibagrus wyckioides TaxID=337641 RepID=A0A9D3SP44_9TELE|nr:hypothetical protein KOW79_006602 [Hemibagrus wyckioides]
MKCGDSEELKRTANLSFRLQHWGWLSHSEFREELCFSTDPNADSSTNCYESQRESKCTKCSQLGEAVSNPIRGYAYAPARVPVCLSEIFTLSISAAARSLTSNRQHRAERETRRGGEAEHEEQRTRRCRR